MNKQNIKKKVLQWIFSINDYNFNHFNRVLKNPNLRLWLITYLGKVVWMTGSCQCGRYPLFLYRMSSSWWQGSTQLYIRGELGFARTRLNIILDWLEDSCCWFSHYDMASYFYPMVDISKFGDFLMKARELSLLDLLYWKGIGTFFSKWH